MQTEPIIQVKNLTKHFPVNNGVINQIFGKEKKVRAVDGVSFNIEKNEVIGLVGESGCGKSTLGQTLLRLIEPTKGSIIYNGEDLVSLKKTEMRKVRGDMQIIFQDSQSSLNSRKTISQIIATPMEIQNIDKGERNERVVQLIKDVGLNERFLNVYPDQLSGGQQQRVNIARALSVNPEFIVCDEVTSALDVSIQAQILNLLNKLKNLYNVTLIFITHDLSVVRYISDRVFVMYLGEFVEKSKTEEMFDNPKHPYTKSLIRSVPNPDPHITSRETLLEGSIPSPINPPTGCRFHTRCPEYIGEICETEEPDYHNLSDSEMVHCHLFNKENT